jgi:hypothetical protein
MAILEHSCSRLGGALCAIGGCLLGLTLPGYWNYPGWRVAGLMLHGAFRGFLMDARRVGGSANDSRPKLGFRWAPLHRRPRSRPFGTELDL